MPSLLHCLDDGTKSSPWRRTRKPWLAPSTMQRCTVSQRRSSGFTVTSLKCSTRGSGLRRRKLSSSAARLGEVRHIVTYNASDYEKTTSLTILQGPTYTDYEVFDLDLMQPYSLKALYEPFSATATHVVLFLPRTSDLKQIAKYGDQTKKLRVMHYCMYGASKALCVFYGEFAME